MKKLKRVIIIVIISAILLVGIIILFISPITKYIIEKYDEKYTGRQIKLDWAYVNPFTGYIHLKNLKIYEFKSDSLFFSANGLSVDFSLLKFLNHSFEIKSLTIDHPVIRVIRDKKRLNFEDVIEKFSTGDSSTKTHASTHVNLLNLKITDGEFHYTDRQIPFDYFIKAGNFETAGKHWYEDTMAFRFSFLSGPTKGGMHGEFHVNFKTSDYLFKVRVNQFDLKPLEQYLKDLANYGNARANLDADLFAKGNFHNAENIIASGHISLNDFHLGKKLDDDYLSFEKLKIIINELSPINDKYVLDSISLIHPFVKYERYDNTDNLQTMFAKKGAAGPGASGDPRRLNILITIGRYIKALSNNFFRSDYKVNNLAIINGDAKFNDYSLSEEFSAGLHGLDIVADSINKKHSRVNVFLKSTLKPYGNVAIKLSIDPNDSSYFDLDYHIQHVAVSMFNPYTITYSSFPLDRGSLDLNGVWEVLGGKIESKNHLVIIDPRVTKRVRGKDKKWLPVPLIFSFIRERGDVIDYEIPITGNLKNPKFHFHDVVRHVLENIFVKPATTPYRFEVKNIEKVIEKSFQVKWPLMGSALLEDQKTFISEMAGFLAKNKEAYITVEPYEYSSKEKEYLVFFEAKKKYFLYANHKEPGSFSTDDSVTVNNLSIRDKNFTGYLKRQIRDTLLFTLQDKCMRLIGIKNMNEALKRLNKNRLETFTSYFKDQQVAERLKIQSLTSTVPFDGFSYYEIRYQGAFPEPLLKAYRKMNELNRERPRKKYLEEHKKSLP
jgi:hypothetical protein